ncbi:hypothetical protein QIH85_24010 [Bradyrhizobium japonicum]|uniref:hypothetical protein n=1 Tax=Bradyrhizobium japonicum TaxID=375 RepID=UPI002714A92F|nr:hypothetical protein [Bradyrhizobium japonicum]WLB24949.1 hypothetical protein QIH85_24010 [Bradyrhizobium japonicum]
MINALIYLVIYIAVIGLIIGLLLWLIDQVPIPEPFHRVARIAIIVVGALIVILLLLSLIGDGPPRLRLGDAAWPMLLMT